MLLLQHGKQHLIFWERGFVILFCSKILTAGTHCEDFRGNKLKDHHWMTSLPQGAPRHTFPIGVGMVAAL